MKDGSVYEYDAPEPGTYDVTKTFLIEMKLNCRKFKFGSVKSRLRVISSFENHYFCLR
jgi:hypothetical protein